MATASMHCRAKLPLREIGPPGTNLSKGGPILATNISLGDFPTKISYSGPVTFRAIDVGS